MKKTFATIATILIFCFVFYMLWHIIDNKKSHEVEIEKLTHIELINQNDNSSTIFHSDKPVIVLYFKTSCQYCIDEINEISENIEKFNQVELILVSSEPQEKITEFASDFETDKLSFFYDKTGKFKNEFNVKSYPAIFIFSKNKKLIKQFKGAVPVDKIYSKIPNE